MVLVASRDSRHGRLMTNSPFTPSGDPEHNPASSVAIPVFFTLSEARKALGPDAPSITTLRAEITQATSVPSASGGASVSPTSNCAGGHWIPSYHRLPRDSRFEVRRRVPRGENLDNQQSLSRWQIAGHQVRSPLIHPQGPASSRCSTLDLHLRVDLKFPLRPHGQSHVPTPLRPHGTRPPAAITTSGGGKSSRVRTSSSARCRETPNIASDLRQAD